MTAEDLIFPLADIPGHEDDTCWGVWSYFCPGCGYLDTMGWVTTMDGCYVWGAYLDKAAALYAAQKIFDDPLCFHCVWLRAKEKKRAKSGKTKSRKKKVPGRKRRAGGRRLVGRYSRFLVEWPG